MLHKQRSFSVSLSLCLSLPLSLPVEPRSLISSQVLIPRANERPHLLTSPIDPILIPAAAPGHFDEGGGDEEAEAGECADNAAAVVGRALFVEEGIDAVVGVLCGEGATEKHGG